MRHLEIALNIRRRLIIAEFTELSKPFALSDVFKVYTLIKCKHKSMHYLETVDTRCKVSFFSFRKVNLWEINLLGFQIKCVFPISRKTHLIVLNPERQPLWHQAELILLNPQIRLSSK